MRRRSGLLSGLLLASLALTAQAQDKLPVTGQPGNDVVNVDDVIRQTIAETAYQTPSGPGFNLEVGGELLFLRPYFDHYSNGHVHFGDSTAVPEFNGFDEPEYDLEPAFRLWLAGVLDNGFGVRVRYFRIDADSDPLTGFENDPPFFTGSETLATGLTMDVLDFEGTVQRAGDGWFCLASAGIRYARLIRTTDSNSTGESDFGGPFSSTLQGETDFDGFGPTFALEGRRRLAGNLFGFLVGRGSLVIGDSTSRAQDQGLEFGEPFTRSSSFTTDDSMWVGEIQLGLEWARPLNRGEVFVRAALEAQHWLDGGHILEGEGENNLSPHDDLTLLGISLGAGIRR